MAEFHTYVTITLASRDGDGWTLDFQKDGVPMMFMGASPEDVFERALPHLKVQTKPSALCKHGNGPACPQCMAMSTALPTFTAREWFPLNGRGYVVAVTIDRDCEKEKLWATFRRCVIDGEEYDVTGVESTCLQMIHKGSPIGLLVKER